MLVLGTNILVFSLFPFHGLQISAKHLIEMLVPDLIRFSSLRYSPDLFQLTYTTMYVGLIQNVRNKACVATHTEIVKEY